MKDLDYKGDVGEKNMTKKISMISAAEMDSFAIQQIKEGHGKKITNQNPPAEREREEEEEGGRGGGGGKAESWNS